MIRLYFHVFLYITLLQLFLIIKSFTVQVKVQQGTLLGTTESTVFDDKIYFAFYGVPYAQAPIGSFRFKDPKPAMKWKKPFDARTSYHGACAQAHIIHKHGLYGYEDCLNLNIYTPYLPDKSDKYLKSVIVWIHGYAFTSSFSHIHGADFLIDNDVIFISVNHRIGAFGFLKVNDFDANANMGLKDIIIALKWIRKNIKQFGGDKNKITVMGSGSAGTFISLIMSSNHNKLFAKAIFQSGGLFSPSIFQGDPHLERNRLMEKLKLNFKDLVNVTTKEIAMMSQQIYTRKEIINFNRPVVPFTPIVETKSNESVITKQSHDIYKNAKTNNFQVPILIGFNSQGSISEVIPFFHNPSLLEKFESFFKYMVPFTDGCKFNYSSTFYSKVATKIKERYFKRGLSELPIHNFLRYATDLHTYPIYKFIITYLSVQNKMYVYKFSYSGKFNVVKATALAGINTPVKGAAEGDEICYILKCEPLWENYVKLKHDLRNRDRLFIKQMAEMWANFAKFDDPMHNNNGNITWPPMTNKEDNVLIFGKENKLSNSKSERRMFTFWNDIYDTYYSGKHCQNGRDEL